MNETKSSSDLKYTLRQHLKEKHDIDVDDILEVMDKLHQEAHEGGRR